MSTSALPKVMAAKLEQARREEEEARKRAEAGSEGGTPPEEQEAPESQPQGAQAGAATVVESQPASPTQQQTSQPVDSSSQFAKLEAQLERLQNNLEKVMQENQRLQGLLNEKEQAKKAAEEDAQFKIEDLSEEERAAFKQSLPTIEKVARKFATQMAKPLHDKVKELEQQLSNTKKDYSSMSEQMFASAVQDRITDMSQKLASPRWQTYLASKIPRTNLTVKDALLQAHHGRDLETIVEIFKGFELEQNSLASQVMPGTVKAAPATKVEEKLKFSDRQKLSEDFRKGRITKQRFDELVAAYDKAEREGRVNFDS